MAKRKSKPQPKVPAPVTPPVGIRDRIQELRRVRASELLANPKNWRLHPDGQKEVLAGILSEIGFAGALLARHTAQGLELIDGHLRADLAGDELVPVLVLDVSEAEAAKILATFDPSATLAEVDREKLDAILREVNFSTPAIQAMLAELAEKCGVVDASSEAEGTADSERAPAYSLVVECEHEHERQELYEYLREKDYRVRMLAT